MRTPAGCKDPFCVIFVIAFMFCFASDVMWTAGGFHIPGCGQRSLMILFSYGVPAVALCLFGIVFSYVLERPPAPFAMLVYSFFGSILLIVNAAIQTSKFSDCANIGSITLTAFQYVPGVALLSNVMLFCCGFRPAVRRKKDVYFY